MLLVHVMMMPDTLPRGGVRFFLSLLIRNLPAAHQPGDFLNSIAACSVILERAGLQHRQQLKLFGFQQRTPREREPGKPAGVTGGDYASSQKIATGRPAARNLPLGGRFRKDDPEELGLMSDWKPAGRVQHSKHARAIGVSDCQSLFDGSVSQAPDRGSRRE